MLNEITVFSSPLKRTQNKQMASFKINTGFDSPNYGVCFRFHYTSNLFAYLHKLFANNRQYKVRAKCANDKRPRTIEVRKQIRQKCNKITSTTIHFAYSSLLRANVFCQLLDENVIRTPQNAFTRTKN